jgi:hypothetical protein
VFIFSSIGIFIPWFEFFVRYDKRPGFPPQALVVAQKKITKK